MAKDKIINLGIKKVSRLTFLKVIVLPKIFTDLLDDDMFVVLELAGETLMFTPISSSDIDTAEE